MKDIILCPLHQSTFLSVTHFNTIKYYGGNFGGLLACWHREVPELQAFSLPKFTSLILDEGRKSSMTNLDWLSFSVNLVFKDGENEENMVLCAPDCCKIQYLDGTNIYKRRAFVLSEAGEKIMTLLWEPHSKIIGKSSMFVEIANKWLYGSLQWIFDFLWKVHPYSMQSLSRLDVCYDFNPNEHQARYIQNLGDNSIYVQGKREGSMFSNFENSGKISRKPRCISWGSKHSDVKWKLYNKTLEIFEEVDGKRWCSKPYIVNMWNEAGINKDNVWRLEVSVTSAGQFVWKEKRVTTGEAIKREWFEDFFQSMYGTRFVTRINEGHKDRSNDKRVWLLGKVDGLYRMKKREPKSSREVVEMASLIRGMIKQLNDPVVWFHDELRNDLLNTTETAIICGRMGEYFYRTFGCTWEKWRRDFENSK